MSSNSLISTTLVLCMAIALGSPASFGQSTCCQEDDQPIMLEFMYLGQNCDASRNGQKAFTCVDSHEGTPRHNEVFVKICATENYLNPRDTWKKARVNLGSTFFFTKEDVGAARIPEATHLFLFEDESESKLLQHIQIQSSCRAPLSLNDQWGSLRLTAIEGEKGGLCSTESTALLPLSFVYFTVLQNALTVEINWGVSGELFEGKMEVQRSEDGRYFSPIATFSASGVSGTSDYSYVDLLPGQRSNYYRLKIFNEDGSATYSQIELVDFYSSNESYVFPNPVMDELSIFGLHSETRVSVTNLLGQIQPEIRQLTFGSGLDMSSLSRGLYYVILEEDDSRTVHSVLKL